MNEKWDVNRKLRTKWLGLGVRLFHSQFTHVLGGLTMASLPSNQDLLFENLFTKLEDDKGGKVFQEITKECFWTLKCFCTYRLKCYEQICGWLQCKMLVGLKSGIMKNFHSILRCNSRSHSRSFPGITMSHSRSRNAGMEFPFPFPKIGNGIFPFPFPKVGNEIFHSRSQSLGMGWAIPVPVPKWPKVIPAHPCPEVGRLQSLKMITYWLNIHSSCTVAVKCSQNVRPYH